MMDTQTAEERMPGYVRNRDFVGLHVMKRYVEPNGKIPLEELYEQYGKKYNLTRGEDFILWLKEVKLKDKARWEVVLEDAPEVATKLPKKAGKLSQDGEEDTTIHKPIKDIDVSDILDLSVRQARLVVPKISNVKLLKIAFKEASQRPNKKYVCDILNKRINEMADLGIS